MNPLRWFSLCVLILACARGARAEEASYKGEAVDDKGRAVYTEFHQVSRAEGKLARSLTEYRAPDGVLIATLRSDYSRSIAMPTYVFEDLRRNYREGLRWENGRYVIFHQDGGKPENTFTIEGGGSVFSCQGWHYYLIDNLDLLERKTVILNLVLPSELRPFPFEVKKLANAGERVSAELRLKNWLFRHFAPKLLLVYDKKERRLLEFQGVSNILDQAGERQRVTIRYVYDGA